MFHTLLHGYDSPEGKIFPKTPLYFSQKSIGRYLTQVTSVITL
jgi:hypothetical protein